MTLEPSLQEMVSMLERHMLLSWHYAFFFFHARMHLPFQIFPNAPFQSILNVQESFFHDEVTK